MTARLMTLLVHPPSIGLLAAREFRRPSVHPILVRPPHYIDHHHHQGQLAVTSGARDTAQCLRSGNQEPPDDESVLNGIAEDPRSARTR